MSARVGGVYSGWLLNHEPVVGFVFRVSYPSESRRRGDDAGSAGFIGPPRHCGSAVRTVGGREITPSSVDRTPYGLDESRSAGRGRIGLTRFGRQPAAAKRFGALTFQNASIRGSYAHDGW